MSHRHHPDTLPAVMVDPATPVSTLVVLAELAAERVRQAAKGYDAAHDDKLTLPELWELIADRYHATDCLPFTPQSNDRRLALEAAALAVAIVETIDRRLQTVEVAKTVAGLDRLEGETVQILADGTPANDARPCDTEPAA